MNPSAPRSPELDSRVGSTESPAREDSPLGYTHARTKRDSARGPGEPTATPQGQATSRGPDCPSILLARIVDASARAPGSGGHRRSPLPPVVCQAHYPPSPHQRKSDLRTYCAVLCIDANKLLCASLSVSRRRATLHQAGSQSKERHSRPRSWAAQATDPEPQ